MDWIIVTKFGRDIGAVGFIGNDAVAIVAFYDDRDGNMDGTVSIPERVASFLSPISVEGMAITEVAMQGRVEMDIILRDPSFAGMAANIFTDFARGLIIDGVYAAYFSRGVSAVGGAVARRITAGMVREFIVRKGFENAVRRVFNAAVER